MSGKGINKGGIERKKHKDLLIILVIVLVATLSFGLGRLSQKTANKPELKIGEIELNSVPAAVYASQVSSKTSQAPQGDGTVVGSRNSTKYHYPWCSGAKRIKEENKIYFSSIEQARGQGYEPAANCPNLK